MSTAELLDPRRWWTLVVLCLSLLVISLDNTILNVALPTLERDLGATSSQLQWIVDSYMLVFAGLLLTAGASVTASAAAGRSRSGSRSSALGSALSAVAGSADMLIASRALMGVGGAFIMPSTLSILTATFPAHERAKAIGAWAGVSGLGIAIGPVAGGWIVEHADWSWIFLVNIPFVVAALLAGRPLVPESRDPAAPRLDFPGFALSTAGLIALVWGVIEAPPMGWTDLPILGAFAAVAASWPRSSPGSATRPSRCSTSACSATAASRRPAARSRCRSSRCSARSSSSPSTCSSCSATRRSRPACACCRSRSGSSSPARCRRSSPERLGAKPVVAGGLTLIAAALLLMTASRSTPRTASSPLSYLMLGMGIGLAMTPATDSVMGSLPLAKASVGSAVNDAARTTGGALGVAILGSVLSSGYRGDMDAVSAGLRRTGIARRRARDGLPHRRRNGRAARDDRPGGVRQRHARRRARRRRHRARRRARRGRLPAQPRGRAGRARPEAVPA